MENHIIDRSIGSWQNKFCSLIKLSLILVGLLVSFSSRVYAEEDEQLYQKHVHPEMQIYAGRSRENVAENVARGHFKNSNKVILVNRDKFPDAISATNISQGNYPVLYTHDRMVTEETMNLLKSMPLDEIYILGGELSVNDSVLEQLKKNLYVEVTRIAGRSRYDANVSAVKENFSSANHVIIASGEVFSDALYGVSYANTLNAPVILTNTSHIEASSIDLLNNLNVEYATIIGGTLTITDAVESQLEKLGIEHNRIAGRNRYIGSAEVASASYRNPKNIIIASGEVFADALVSAPLAQKLDAPILLVRSDDLEERVYQYLIDSRKPLEKIHVHGGDLSVSENLRSMISKAALPYASSGSHNFIDIPFNISYVSDLMKDRNYKELSRKGELGTQEIKSTIYYYDDGYEYEELYEEVVENPIDEVIVYGTNGLSETGPTQGYTIVDLVDNEGHKHHQAEIIEFRINAEIDLLNLVSLKETDQSLIDEKANDKTLSNNYMIDKDVFGFRKGAYPIKLSKESIDLVNNKLIDVNKVNEIYLSLINKERERMGKRPTYINFNLAEGAQKRTFRYKPYMGVLNKPWMRGNKEWYEDFEYLNDSENNRHYAEYLYESIYSFGYKGNPYTLASEKYLATALFEERMQHSYSLDIMGSPTPFYIDYQLFDTPSNIWDLTDDFTVTIIRDIN